MSMKNIKTKQSTSPQGLVDTLNNLIVNNDRALKQITKDIKKYRSGYWGDKLRPLFKYTQGYLDALKDIKTIIDR